MRSLSQNISWLSSIKIYPFLPKQAYQIYGQLLSPSFFRVLIFSWSRPLSKSKSSIGRVFGSSPKKTVILKTRRVRKNALWSLDFWSRHVFEYILYGKCKKCTFPVEMRLTLCRLWVVTESKNHYFSEKLTRIMFALIWTNLILGWTDQTLPIGPTPPISKQ